MIAGLDEYGAGKAKTIPGSRHRTSRTIVFRLTQPTGDFLTAWPCRPQGRSRPRSRSASRARPAITAATIVSTGPYMLAGADELDASSCTTLEPIRLRRSDTADARTQPELRRGDRLEGGAREPAGRVPVPVNTNLDDIMDRVAAGELEDVLATSRRSGSASTPRPGAAQVPASEPGDVTAGWDEPHPATVRRHPRAQSDELGHGQGGDVQAWGGPLDGKVANHIVPDTMFSDGLAEFAPYKTPGDRGNVAKAKAAMKGSKYDTNGDGTCSAPACKNVLLLTDTLDVDPKLVPVVQASAAKIGITFAVRAVAGPIPLLQTPSKNIPITEVTGWGKDYATRSTSSRRSTTSSSILPNGQLELVARRDWTPAKAQAIGIRGR